MRVYRYILLLVLLSVLGVSCSVKELDGVSAVPDGVAQIELGLRIPAPIVTRAMSEYGVVENDEVGFVVFAFDQTASSTLVWMLKSGDTNYESNLSNYSGTTAIKWRSGVFPAGYDSGDSAYGTLYIEAPVDSEALELLVLANVNLSSVSANVTDGVINSYNLGDTVLTPSKSSLADVETALSALDYSASTLTGTYGPVTDVWDLTTGEMVTDEVGTETDNYIPMAGRATLSSGVQVGATGAVSLRRSLAKVSVEIECSEASLVKFWPKELKIMNVSDSAAPYAPDDENGEQVSFIPSPDGEFYTALTFFEDLPSSVSSMDEALSVSAQLYVPETLTWKSEGDKDTHLCVLVGGIFDSGGIYGSDGNINDYDNWMETNPAWTSPLVWYRLDFIPSDANSSEEELTEILRNHHYKFTVSNLAYLGSYSETAALAMEYPDNYVISSIGEGSWTLFVEDEDINSVTVAYESSSDDGTDIGANDYVGVSGVDLTIELPASSSSFTGNEATHLKMVTNYAEWTAGSGIDLVDCDGVFSFSFTEDDGVNENVYWYNGDTGEMEYPAHSGYLWIWADGQSGSMESASAADARASASASLYSGGTLNVGKSYTFYICVGVVRKEIHIILAEE